MLGSIILINGWQNDILRKELQMGFVNGLLTEKEIETFRELNISYGEKIASQDDNVIGIRVSRFAKGVKSTFDRDKKMYLFYTGIDSSFAREELWSPNYFLFISFETSDIAVIRIELKRVEDNSPEVYKRWEKINIKGEYYKSGKEINEISRYYQDIKEALAFYGTFGEIDDNVRHNVKFDF